MIKTKGCWEGAELGGEWKQRKDKGNLGGTYHLVFNSQGFSRGDNWHLYNGFTSWSIFPEGGFWRKLGFWRNLPESTVCLLIRLVPTFSLILCQAEK